MKKKNNVKTQNRKAVKDLAGRIDLNIHAGESVAYNKVSKGMKRPLE